jgi:hypothetical protein
MQTALGGAEKIAAIRDYEETVQARTWNGDGTPLGLVWKRTRWMRSPNVVRLDQIGPRDTYVLYYDGSSGSGWEILPDLTNPDPLKTTGKAVALAGGELRFATSYLSGFQFNQWLADRTPGYTVTSPAPNVLRIEYEDHATDFTLDPATWLPAKSAGVSLADPDRPVQAELHYEAWTTVAGIHFPTRRANYHNGLKLGEITDATIRVNAGLTLERLAARPPDLAPEIPRRSRTGHRRDHTMERSRTAPAGLAGLSLAALLLAPSPGQAQARPCPRPPLTRLAQLAGHWSVEWGYAVEGELRAVENASATIDIAASSCAVRERLEGRLRGAPLAVTTLTAASTDDSLERVYVDSEHGAILVFAGAIIGDTIRFLWRRDLGARRQLLRHDYFALTPASFATETRMSPNGGGDWIIVQRARYRRVPQ